MFRKDAVTHHAWHARVLLLPGVPWGWVASGCALFMALLLLFLIYGSYTRRVTVSGEVSTFPRAANLYATVQGVVVKQFVKEGQNVSVGMPLYEINVSKSSKQGLMSDNQRKEVETQLTRITQIIDRLQQSKSSALAMLTQQKKQYEQAYRRSSDIVTRAQEGVRLMKSTLDNYRDYQRQGLITRDQLTNQAALYYQQQNGLLNLSSQNEQNALQIVALENQLTLQAADFDNQIHQMALQRAERQKELLTIAATESVIVHAVAEGYVNALSVTEGQMVNVGDSLMQLLPQRIDHYALVLWVPNHAVPYLAVGDGVNIRYEAFPAQTFGQFAGTLSLISTVPATAQEMLTWQGAPRTAITGSEPLYKVVVRPAKQTIVYQGKSVALKNGMKAESILLLETRPLWQWMFSPFYDLKHSAAGRTDA